MANSIITPTVIAKEALMQLENNLVMGNNVHREYKKEFVKVGSSVNIRRPVKFSVSDGATRVNQDVEEANSSISVDQRKHVSWKFGTQDLTLSIEEYSERYIKPACIALANKVDLDLCGLYDDVWNYVGTPGLTVNSFADFAKAPERLDEGAVPQDNRKAVLSAADHWGLLGAQSGLYMQDVAKGAYRKGSLGMLGGIDTFMDQNTRVHTTGTHATGSTPLVNGASQNTTYANSGDANEQSLVTDGWANSTAVLKAGDVFTLADVYAVNPVSKEARSFLQQFVVKSDASSDGSGGATLTISPAIITSGPYQTVDAAPADNAAITVLGSEASNYRQNLVFHKNAFALVTCPLEMPDGAAFKARESKNGLSIRVVKDYDIDSDNDIIRLDILYGKKAIYPDLAARLAGTA